MGKPSKGTPADKRLSSNRGTTAKKSSSAAPFGGKKAAPFGSAKRGGKKK